VTGFADTKNRHSERGAGPSCMVMRYMGLATTLVVLETVGRERGTGAAHHLAGARPFSGNRAQPSVTAKTEYRPMRND